VTPEDGAAFRERLVRWSPPGPFPTGLLAAQCVPTGPDQAAELEYRDGELSGNAGGQAVSVVLPTLNWKRLATLHVTTDRRTKGAIRGHTSSGASPSASIAVLALLRADTSSVRVFSKDQPPCYCFWSGRSCGGLSPAHLGGDMGPLGGWFRYQPYRWTNRRADHRR
jgi:hypothetical protein